VDNERGIFACLTAAGHLRLKIVSFVTVRVTSMTRFGDDGNSGSGDVWLRLLLEYWPSPGC
jgi:hypothetical protein